MNKLKIATIVVACLSVVSAQAATIATHQDPSAGAPSVFDIDLVNNQVTGGWSLTGLNLSFPIIPTTLNNLNMTIMNPIAITGTSSVGPFTIHTLSQGEIRYWSTDINTPEFQINFDSGSIIEPAAATAADLTGNNVSFSGSAISAYTGLLSNEIVNYSFSNPEVTANGRSYTASMTASADVVPEPVTMVVLGTGIAALAARKRKRS